MQDVASQNQSRGHGKRSPAIIGIGAAIVASAVTAVMLMGNTSPVARPEQAVSATRQCTLMQRRLLVSTEHGGGTVRFRASGWVSPPFTLTAQPQVVVFPLPRPDSTPVQEQMSIEGNASDMVITSEVTDLHREFDVTGAYAYTVVWAPRKSC